MTREVVSLDGIRAVFFDLDGTLQHSHASNDQTLLEIASRAGLAFSNEQRLKALRWAHYYWAQSAELIQDLETYGNDQDSFLTNYIRRYAIEAGCHPDRAASLAPPVYRDLKESELEEAWVSPEVPETLRRLKAAGLILAVVSNREEPIGDVLGKLDLGSYFDFALTSGEVGSWKPDAEIFRRAVQLAGIAPRQAIYVGDNLYTDIVGARNAGLRAVLLDPEGVFPRAECPVIRSIGELGQALTDGKMHQNPNTPH